MKLTDFDYHLPEDLIAQYPLKDRDQSRLLIVERVSGRLTHDVFCNIGQYLPPSSLVVVNNSKVIPARLLGEKVRTGGHVEVFLLKQVDMYHYEAMLRPLGKIREGERLVFPGGIECVLTDREKRIVRFDDLDLLPKLLCCGHIPLPPYIKRKDEPTDRIQYQTVYARQAGSVAAPTAGLHFTKGLINSLKKSGRAFAEVTLHVNYGTFKPVDVVNVTDHPMHSESYNIRPSVERCVQKAKLEGRPVVAVGTTSCRVLESWSRTGLRKGDTHLFMYPGVPFQVVDTLITNFHLPRSTLLMLVSAFAGVDLVQKAYAEAIRKRYRFYSYGDAMIFI